MAKILEPAGEHVLVVDLPRETTIDGVVMPDNVKQQEMVYGAVTAVGPDARHTKKGDFICYGPYAGKTIVVVGSEFRLLIEGQIEGYIRDDESVRVERPKGLWEKIWTALLNAEIGG